MIHRPSVPLAGSRPMQLGRALACRVLMGLALTGAASQVACGGSSEAPSSNDPSLLALDARTVAVNETLKVDIVVDNPQGLALDFTWKGPELAGLDRTVKLVGSPSGGEFSYSPLSSHVGEHEFFVSIRSSRGTSQQSLRITVLPAASAAPVFLRPGAGATFDLEQSPCVSVDVEVRDDDSASVDLAVPQGLPSGADFVATGPKSAALDWCPSPSQIDASDRWPLVFEADDQVHAPTQHAFMLILRRTAKEGCPGEPPDISIQSPKKGQEVVSSTGYDVIFEVTDDKGLRDAPLAYWTTTEQEDLDKPNLSEFEPVIAKEQLNGTWKARIPSLGLTDGEKRLVNVILSATDNDDANGTSCDHRTDTGVHRFIAVGGDGVQKLEDCTLCDFSSDCESGFCAVTIVGGLCVSPCDPSNCSGGCVATTSMEGGVLNSCGPPSSQCEAVDDPVTAECSPDAFEPNNSVSEAKPFTPGVKDASICAADLDFYRLDVGADTLVTVRIEPKGDGGDLDLQLRDQYGELVAVSAGAGSDELIAVCVALPQTIYAEVLGYSGQQGEYRFERTDASDSCCEDDGGEPDNGPASARLLLMNDIAGGTICPFDDDYFKFQLGAPAKVTLTLAGASGIGGQNVDVDLQVYGPSGAIVASGETFGDEQITFQATPGQYIVRVFGYMGDSGEYLLESASSGLAACSSDKNCPLGTVCSASVCEDAFCANKSECPSGYQCPVAGPTEDESMCSAPCSANSDCRPAEACKWFYEGRYCGLMGAGQNGAPCGTFMDCGGQRSCVPWPGGYCARDNCVSNTDCEAGTYCVKVDGVGACLLDCWPSDSICRLSEGYDCAALKDTSGSTQFVCLPGN